MTQKIFSVVIGITVLVFLLMGYRIVQGQSENTLTISGNIDQVKFDVTWDLPNTISVLWGVSGQPLQTANITLINRTAIIVPPTGTVSIFFNQPGVIVSTTFKPLTNDGWFEVPQIEHIITVNNNLNQVQFTANYDPISPISVTWGINSKPPVTEFLTFDQRIAIVNPPAETVSMLFAPPNVTVSTIFINLGAGWYQIPATVSTPTPTATATPTPTSTPTIIPTITPFPTESAELDLKLYLPLLFK